ncbi:MAG: outer membrane beta-barrel protein [Betaproteobacteria bacterium]|nr:MAG: outer membrane beta-barrel protein [Betaproteobacteria bacterium]
MTEKRVSIVRIAFAGLVTVLIAPYAAADEGDRWYAVATAGRSNLRDVCTIAEAQVSLASCDDESVGWQVLLGRTFGKLLSGEVGYIDAGEAVAYEAGGASGTMKVRPQMITATGVLNISLGKRVNLFAKAGAVYYDTTIDFTGGFVAATGLTSKQERGLEPTIGGGVEWNFSRAFALRVEYAEFNVNDVWFGDIDMTTAGIRVNF